MTISKKCTCFVNDSCTSGDSKATGVAHLTYEEVYDVKRFESGSVAACTYYNAPSDVDVVRAMFDEHFERVVQEELETNTDRELGPLFTGSSCQCSRRAGQSYCRMWAGEDFEHFAFIFGCEYSQTLYYYFGVADEARPTFTVVL